LKRLNKSSSGVAKKKLSRFEELKTYSHVIQPSFSEVFQKDYRLKGKWKTDFFHNANPLVLELGCGKGEYTVGLAKHFSGKNFIGIDIKGARIWKGAREVHDKSISNAAFLRTRIDHIESFFGKNEVDEIWITFPDPQLKKPRKRLTSPVFLNRYQNFLSPESVIHLKTDSEELYQYTLNVLNFNQCEILEQTGDLYSKTLSEEYLSIKTFYESQFLEKGKAITYIRFKLTGNPLKDVPE
jgi:tRNA (guanine-N7-)-methyltransferase